MKLSALFVLCIALPAQTPSGCKETPGQGTATPPTGSSTQAAAKPAARGTARSILAQIRRPSPQRTVSCWCGSVGAAALTATDSTQQVTILPGMSGSFRFDHLLVQEATRFADGPATLAVSVGRPAAPAELIPPFSLKSYAAPQNFWFERPAPPTLIGTYDLILEFTASSALGTGKESNFTSGTVNWEVCGYTVQ